MAFPTASEIIAREILESIARRRRRVETLEKELSEARRDLEQGLRQMRCNHTFETVNSFCIVDEKCTKCGWVHSS